MPDTHPLSHHADVPIEDRFLSWIDELVDPAAIERTADQDFAEIADTARSIQRVAGPATPPLPPTDRIDAIWEEIMNTTPTARTIAPTLPASGSIRSARFRLPNPAPPAGWRSYLMTALLITILAVAGVALAWRVAGPFGGGDGNFEQARHPGVAHPATPATESAAGCPRTSDMLVFQGEVPESAANLDLTFGVIEEDGDFVLHCSGDGQAETLAAGVASVRSLSWPGTVLLIMEDGSAVAFNVTTHERLVISTTDLPLESADFVRNSPWFLSPANAAHTDWRITNLRTMESMLLSDEINGVLEEPIRPAMIWTPHGHHAVFTAASDFMITDTPPNDPGATIAELPGSLVLNETLESRRWIDDWGQMEISTDGEIIAYQTQVDLEPMVRVEDALSGNLLAEVTNINFNYPSNNLFAFTGDGDSLVVLDEGELRLTTTESSSATRVIETTENVTGVHPTGVPGRVLVEYGDEGESLTQSATPVGILDTSSGQITDLDGLYYKFGFAYDPEPVGFSHIVTALPSEDSGSQTVLQLVDIRTSQVVLSSSPIEASIATLTERGMSVTPDRSGEKFVASLTSEWSLLFDLNRQSVNPVNLDGLNQLGLPDTDVFWTLTPSTDGEYLFAWGIHLPPERKEFSNEQYLAIAKLAPEPEWALVSNDVFSEDDRPSIAMIPGVPVVTESNEPAVLEAQEIPPLEAAPGATPAAGAGACNLTRDIPVVTGATDLPWDRAMLVLDGGTLALQCDGKRTVLETGVLGVAGSHWPGAMLLTMEDGSVRGVNLISGASGELAPPTSYSEPFFPEPLVEAMPGSRWMVLPANADLTDWRIVDFETMESLLLSDEIGGVLPTPLVARLNTSGETAAVITFPRRPSPDDLVRAPSNEASETNAGQLPSSNAALVIVDSLENRRWTEASSVPEMSVSTSHDETQLAIAVPTDRGMTIRVERLSDGELVADTGIDYNAGDSFFVLDNEAGVLHLTNQRLDLVTWNPEPASETLLELEPSDGLPTMALTADPNVVVVSAINSIGDGRGYLVDIATREVIEIPNLLHRSLSLQASEGRPPQHVLAAAPYGDAEGQSTLQMIDVTTGETIVTSDPIDMEPAQLQQGLSMLRANGTVGFSFNLPGHVIVLNASTGEAFEFQVPTDVEGVPENHWWHVYPSYDGTFFLTSPDFEPGSPHYMRELTPNADWIELPPTASGIVRGAASAGVPTEPPPQATEADAGPSAESGTSDCDLSKDILVLDGEVEAPLPGTTVLTLVDGELWLRCGDNSSLIEGRVARIFPGSTWPGAFLVTMEDGTLRGINVASGARGDFGPANVLEGTYTFPYVAPRAPWAAIPGNLELTDWRFIDLRTMESRLLSEEIGGVLPGSIALNPSAFTPEAVIFGFPGAPVLAGERAQPLSPGGATPAVSAVSELPFDNAALVIDGSFEHIRWVEVDSRSMMRATISPDGDLVAIAQSTDGGLTVRVERLADGEVVAETGIVYGAGDTMLLLNDGAGLLHLASDRLDLVTWDGEVTTETLLRFDAGTGPPILAHTIDPDVVVVGTTGPSGTTMGYLVDVSTGDVTEVPHMLLAPFVNIAYRSNEPVGHVLAAAPADDGDQATLQMIDVTTGEAALTSEPIELTAEELSAQTGTLRAEGTRGFVFLPGGQTIVLDAATGEATWIAPPETDDAMQWNLYPSPAGTYLVPGSSPSGDMFAMDLSRGEWRQLPAGSDGWFLPGTGI